MIMFYFWLSPTAPAGSFPPNFRINSRGFLLNIKSTFMED